MIECTDDNFEETVKDGVCVVDFYADWCGPCKATMPEVEAAHQETDNVVFCKVNVDESSLADKFGVRSIPTLIYMKNGEPVDALTGSTTKDKILDKLKQVQDG